VVEGNESKASKKIKNDRNIKPKRVKVYLESKTKSRVERAKPCTLVLIQKIGRFWIYLQLRRKRQMPGLSLEEPAGAIQIETIILRSRPKIRGTTTLKND